MPVHAPIRLVAGLGNPGKPHERTRHNAGWWFSDALAERLGVRFAPQPRFSGDVARDGELRIVKPSTYMNESGRSVGALARFLGIAPAEILVVHDELDLVAGAVKMKLGGGVAGHNGLKDIRAHLATPEFWRLRLGIGHPRDSGTPQLPVVDYVLKPPLAVERDLVRAAIDRALDAWPAIAAGDFEKAMLLLHTRETR
ncbi:MAG: aminoacyl-tRNA hydrolase [Betaproteobacteria bacterium]